MVGLLKERKKVYLKTYGCQMNVYDSERIIEQLAQKGFELLLENLMRI